MKKLITVLLIMSLTMLWAKTLVTVNGHEITDALLAQGYENLDETQMFHFLE